MEERSALAETFSPKSVPHSTATSIPMGVFSLIRYRFFLYAGLLPYLLGAAWAYGMEHAFVGSRFGIGLLGIFFSVCGVEAFNEYFDAKMGTDRVFNPNEEEIPEWMLYFGWSSFALAALCGLWLAKEGGWPVILYMVLGGQAAAFYVGPPVRWVYRGLGETMIALSYGPWMTLGSLTLHTGHFSWGAFAASLVPALLIGSLAVVNAVPDFYQDRLVGKRNLVVRFGRRNGVFIYLTASAIALSILIIGAATGLFPKFAIGAAVFAAPLLWKSGRAALVSYEEPRKFIPAVRAIVLCYVTATSLFTLSLLLHRL